MFALTDETFSLLTTLHENDRQRLILPVSLLNQCYWVIGTILGILVGAGLNDWVPHLDFALVCLFAILAYEQFKAVKAYYPIFIAIIAFTAAFYFISDWLLLSAICVSLGLIIIHFFMSNKSAHKQAI